MEHTIMPLTGDRIAVVLYTKDNALNPVNTDDTAPNPYLEDAGLETDPDKVSVCMSRKLPERGIVCLFEM